MWMEFTSCESGHKPHAPDRQRGECPFASLGAKDQTRVPKNEGYCYQSGRPFGLITWTGMLGMLDPNWLCSRWQLALTGEGVRDFRLPYQGPASEPRGSHISKDEEYSGLSSST
jgi:hypothetical protein